jgi:hypothetical protein
MQRLLIMGIAMSVSACVVGDATDDIRTSQQLISGWAIGAWGTTTDTVGLDTGWSTASSTCVLSAVLGNLTQGASGHAGDVQSEAAIEDGVNGHYFILGHGGAHQGVWWGNPVMAGGVCVPYVTTAFNIWTSSLPQFGVTPPKKLANSFSTRRCFLTSISSGGGIFGQWADSVSVVQIGIGQTDAQHPTTGWYLQGTLASNPDTGQQATATAACIDFPSISAEWGGAFGGATNTMTTGGGVKMCGLTGIYGAFNVNSYSNGVSLNAPSTQNGNWTMTVSANKFASADCVQ